MSPRERVIALAEARANSAPRRRLAMSLRARGFTLLEVIAVVLILGGIFLVMGSVFRGIASTATDADYTVITRRGVLLVGRIASDLAGAVLVEKPEEADPLEHPWLFYADSRGGRDGANRLKFDSRSARPAGEHAGDLAVVAYWVERGDRDDLRLMRWTSPALPESLDRDFPRSGDAGAQVVASGLTRFAVRFTDDEGQQVSSWDSSTLERSSQLPVSAEITLGLADPTAPEGEREFVRRVVLPIRPIDLAAALSGEANDDEGDEDDEDDEDGGDDCVTVAQCRADNAPAFAAWIAQQPDPAAAQAMLDANTSACADDIDGLEFCE